MRTSKFKRSLFPRSSSFILPSIFLLFLAFPQFQTRSVIDPVTLVSEDNKDGVVTVDQSARIKTEVREVSTGIPQDEIPINKNNEVAKKIGVGIRRFDADEPEGEAPEKGTAKRIHIGSETHVEVSEVNVSVLNEEHNSRKGVTANDQKQGELLKRTKADVADESFPNKPNQEDAPLVSENIESGLIKTQLGNTPESDPASEMQIPTDLPLQNSDLPMPNSVIESLKQEATLIQQQIKDNNFFQRIKEPVLVMPEVPLLTELDILQSLKSISQTKKHDLSIEPLDHHLLSDKQFEIVQCSASIIAEQQRQNFLGSMYDCVRNLSVMNCMRIFVYPIIAETVPQLIVQNIPGLPIELNVSDFLPNRNKTKTARAGTFLIYPMVNTEELFIGILKDVLDTYRSFESVPSYIDPMNATFVKLLSPGQMKILQMSEKILPVDSRREYSDRMYSCVKRFEYFSCLRYFAWPMMKKYYSALPNFPEYEILYPVPTFTEYPILPFPLEPGQLPEVVEADLKGVEPRPEALILRILKEGIKPGQTYFNSSSNATDIANKNTSALIPLEQLTETLPIPENIPVRFEVTQDQLNSLHVAKQILPPQVRAEFVSQSLKCIREINYYACMKYYTWPIVRQNPPTLPQFPDLSEWFQWPNLSQFFQFPEWAGFFQLPSFPAFGQPSPPSLPTIPGVPMLPGTIPQIPGIPVRPDIPTLPQIPGAPSFPMIPQAPTIPQIPSIPMIPENPMIPQIPGIPQPAQPAQPAPLVEASDLIQDVQKIRLDTSAVNTESRHGLVEESYSEEPIKKIQISSRKTDTESNVPVISIAGTEFKPILSEKPETVIFTILRLYQISDPSLTKTLTIPFLNSSTPEYSFLSLHQENTILLAKSMLPESERSSFFKQMISCVRDKNFMTCSKEVMFPTLSEYFPNLPTFPILESSENPRKLPNSTKLLSNSHQISETNVKTDKHGETVTITDTRFVPIFSEHPEGVVMNILRAVQISAPDLIPGSSKTREINAQFGNLLSDKQITIIEIAESLLPEELRESFVKKMISCSKDNEFLDCTRDIAFPSVSQYYPNLPSFPNFGNQLGTSAQLLGEEFNKPEIDAESVYLQQVENHLQNEIENILIRAATVMERSRTPDVIDDPVQIPPGALSKQQRNIMRLSNGILPASIRPAYHARMMECMQSSSFVSCMQNVGWPILRLDPLLLNSPLRPTFDYTPQEPGPYPTSPVVIPQAEFNYENLGRVQEAAQEQGRSAADITSSVGRKVPVPEIPPYPGQPFASFVDVSKERVDPVELQLDAKPEFTVITGEHNRRKRSPTLLDSYPEHNSNENKASVRRNLPRTTFPNMTETELLQLMIHVKNSKEDLRDLQSKKYFVDDLDSEAKKTLTSNQVQILRLVEDLNPETSRGIMMQLWQCIRSLSILRCAGVFIWPMIASNLPSFGPFSGRSKDDTVQDFFGMPPNDFEKELMVKKQEFEDVLLSWYKSLMEDRFETNVGFLKFKGHGNGELGISLAGLREGRAKVIKDNKNLPSILTIISDIMEDVLEPKPNSNKNKKDPKKGKNLMLEENNYQILLDTKEDSKIERSTKDERILAALLEKLRTNDSDTKNDNYGQFFNLEDAYKAFELLFGTKLTSEIESRIKSFSENHFRSFINRKLEEETPIDEKLKILPLEVHEKLLKDELNDQFEKSKIEFKDDLFQEGGKRRKKHRTELSVQLPRLNDVVISRKITSNIINMARGLKTKMSQMMPGIGMVISFILQMTIAHARTAASVAGVMSNMALGMGMFSMVRDALFGQTNNPKIKYVYDTETTEPGVSWPKEASYWK